MSSFVTVNVCQNHYRMFSTTFLVIRFAVTPVIFISSTSFTLSSYLETESDRAFPPFVVALRITPISQNVQRGKSGSFIK